MIILGSYVVFFIFMMGMTFAIIDEKYRSFYNEMLDVHNEYRAKHGVGPLKLNEELCEKAAKYLITKEGEKDLKSNYGTNVYFNAKGSELNARKMFACWYEKKDDISYKEIPRMVIYKEPFINIVWEGTTKIGVAVFEDKHFDVILVIYSPRGDISEEPEKEDKKVPPKRLKEVNHKISRRLNFNSLP